MQIAPFKLYAIKALRKNLIMGSVGQRSSSSSIILCLLFSVVAVTSISNNHNENDFASLHHIKPRASAESQTCAVQDLVKRLLPTRYQHFHVHVDPQMSQDHLDVFEISSDGTTVSLSGSTGVAVAWGVQHYLVQYCNCHIAWTGNQLSLPPVGQLPVIQPPVRITSPNRFRYYQNVCTVSYTFAWWDWTRWERHLDWMALSGINLPLAFNGQEAIWQRVYLNMGLKQRDLDEHFGGPAFLAWARMGNIDGWGGPLPPSWHSNQLALQHQILTRMRSLGMIPVLPAFAGHVPKSFSKHFPNASISNLDNWGHFEPDYCCTAFLDPQDPLFKQVGKAFIDAMAAEFNGTDHIYSADSFNENTPSSSDPAYLSAASRGVYEGIIAGDPQGVWLMQGWLFQNSDFWGPAQVKALLHGVPIGRMIVLDLFSDVRPLYTITESFYGQPFIWCMLHNFGGNIGFYGKLDSVNQGPIEGRSLPNSTMIGMGLTPEGILQNYVMYNFLTDRTLQLEATNVTQWVKQYSRRRYSPEVGWSQAAADAWTILQSTVYNNTNTDKDHVCAIPVRRPTNRMTSKIWYDYTKVADAWRLMLDASKTLGLSSLFRYDLVDVTRNVLQDLAFDFYQKLMQAFDAQDKISVKSTGLLLTNLILDMDNITSSHKDWLLGTWLHDARSMATSETERDQYEYNARNQLTLWGPTGNIIDYANKQWGGLLRSYYHGRWHLFVAYLLECLDRQDPYNQDVFNRWSFLFESNWTYGRESYPTSPVGDSVQISQALFTKYQPFIQEARQSGRARERMVGKKDKCGFQSKGSSSRQKWYSGTPLY